MQVYRRAAHPRYSAGRPVGAGAFFFRKEWVNTPAERTIQGRWALVPVRPAWSGRGWDRRQGHAGEQHLRCPASEVPPPSPEDVMSFLTVNGTTLYYELRGKGPSLLFISGAVGDAGQWSAVADGLADEFTVLTYDRRANSRSPRPEGWSTTTMDEQADDAAALVAALGLGPVAACGNSMGAIILTCLTLRFPEVVRGAVLHEPPLVAVSSAPDVVAKAIEDVVAAGMAEGGPPAAVERFQRWVAGDDAYESFDPDFRARLLTDGEVLFGVEVTPALNYLPAARELAEVRVPCVVTSGADNRDPSAAGYWLFECCQWLAGQLGVPVTETPGAHIPHLTHAPAFVDFLRPALTSFGS
ncbi:alpha/beta fold hydrolase [Amycolatopsis sp. NPDC098790]|uniref:alpha/beta fold hydrolase n=1 Tax=Amycolatopsis sp. NPDC098790 TaxID=3363939 RepID=UPI003801A32E